MSKWWKNPRVLGQAIYTLSRGLAFSMRIKIIRHDDIDPKRPYLFAVWHGKQFLPSLVMHRQHLTPQCIMVSPSRDGSILMTYLSKYGYQVIRGSSRNNNIAVLKSLNKKIMQGFSVGFAIDGPIGPLHVIKPGIIYLSQKFRVPIIPMGSAFDKYWLFAKAWDKFELPKPFARACLVLGAPYLVSENATIEQGCLELKNLLHAADQQAAKALLKG